jgi:uncharacterized protein
MDAFIIHGTFGHPGENWFPWLKEELEKLGYNVHVPTFPTPENQSLESWREVFSEYKVSNDTILIGHSLGPAFILDILEKHKARAAFFVAGFTGLLDIKEVDSINKTIVDRNFDWETIKSNCKKFFVINSDNDPYVPIKKAKELASNLGTEPILVRDAGHFNEKAGYTSFPKLLEMIKECQ